MAKLHNELTICFMGAGSMAEAIIRGLVEQETIPAAQIIAVNRSNQERLSELHQKYGITIAQSNEDKAERINKSDIVVASMKPKDAKAGLSAVKALLRPQQLLVSVIAGLSIDTIEQITLPGMPIVRTMPNTSSTIGLGATGISCSSSVTEVQKDRALAIFQSIGIVEEIDESLMNAVTGVSGSGPAYVYYLMESMIHAGMDQGLSAEAAKRLTVQTVLGAATMVQTTGEEPDVLRKKVMSPGGTTEAAIRMLDSRSFPEAVQDAVRQAASRGQEISEQIAASEN